MTWWRRVFFAAGQLGLMALARFFFSWHLQLADSRSPTGEVLLNAALVGAAFLAGRIFDGVTDPIAGLFSDWWVRSGRQRRTLLLYALVVPAIGVGLIFSPTHALSEAARWALVGGGMVVFFVGYTLYCIPFWSLTDDYAGEDEAERRILSTALGAGLILATAVVGVGTPALIQALGYQQAAVWFALPCVGLMALPYLAQPRGGPRARPVGRGPSAPLGALLRAALGHRRFLSVLLIFAGSQMAFMVITVAAPFIAVRLLGGGEADVARIMAPFLATAIPAFLVAPALSRRFGWERVVVGASLALAVVYAGAGALGEAWLGTPMTTAMAVFACGGPMAAVILALEAEAITACAREAGGEVVSLYFGVFNFLVKALNGVAAALTGLLVTLSNQVDGFTTAGVRLMPVLAGVLLVIGCLGYAAARPARGRR